MNNIPLVAKLAILPTVLMLALAATCFVVLANIDAGREDSLQVDIAGRQGMLNQRFVKEVLIAMQSEGQAREVAVANSNKTVDLFRSSLEILKQGGELSVTAADGTLTKYRLQPLSSQ